MIDQLLYETCRFDHLCCHAFCGLSNFLVFLNESNTGRMTLAVLSRFVFAWMDRSLRNKVSPIQVPYYDDTV